jgi:hypothetical protein
MIRHGDGLNFSTELETCNGSDSAIISARSCVVPVNLLRTAPFSLEWGSSIWAKITVTNIIGTTAYSAPGNGAIMLTSSDAPLDLSNVPDITTGSQVGLMWTDGLVSGGAPVEDYQLTWDQGTGTFVVLMSNILS